MSTSVREILAQIELLDEAGQEELQAALQLRSRAQWEQLAKKERDRSSAEGVTEQDIDQAVNELR